MAALLSAGSRQVFNAEIKTEIKTGAFLKRPFSVISPLFLSGLRAVYRHVFQVFSEILPLIFPENAKRQADQCPQVNGLPGMLPDIA